MFRHEGAVGPAEPDVNLRAANLNAAIICVPTICSGNDPEAAAVDLTCPKFFKIVMGNSCVPITELWLLGSAYDLGIY